MIDLNFFINIKKRIRTDLSIAIDKMTKSSASSEFDVYELFRMEVGNVGDTI